MLALKQSPRHNAKSSRLFPSNLSNRKEGYLTSHIQNDSKERQQSSEVMRQEAKIVDSHRPKHGGVFDLEKVIQSEYSKLVKNNNQRSITERSLS